MGPTHPWGNADVFSRVPLTMAAMAAVSPPGQWPCHTQKTFGSISPHHVTLALTQPYLPQGYSCLTLDGISEPLERLCCFSASWWPSSCPPLSVMLFEMMTQFHVFSLLMTWRLRGRGLYWDYEATQSRIAKTRNCNILSLFPNG